MPTIAQEVSSEALHLVTWGYPGGVSDDIQYIAVHLGPRPSTMAHSVATGQALVSNGHLGADIIRLAAGEAFAPHTHPGDHLLIVIGGHGTITYRGEIHLTKPGQIYMVEGLEPHAVGAITDHVILAIGCPHKPVGDPDRMKIVEYQEILAEVGSLHCLICDKVATYPERLVDLGCPHDPSTAVPF